MTDHRRIVSELPKPIVDKLQRSLERIRRVIILRGTLAVAAVALLAFLGVMGIDALITLYSDLARWLLSLGAFAVTAAAAYRYLVHPLARHLTLADVARVIETRHPEL